MESENFIPQRDIDAAYVFWRKPEATLKADKLLAARQTLSLQNTREAVTISSSDLARKLQISRAAYAKLERNEANGTITLSSLMKAAEVLKCDFIYYFQPRDTPRFIDRLWRPAIAIALRMKRLQQCRSTMRGNAIGNAVTRSPSL